MSRTFPLAALLLVMILSGCVYDPYGGQRDSHDSEHEHDHEHEHERDDAHRVWHE